MLAETQMLTHCVIIKQLELFMKWCTSSVQIAEYLFTNKLIIPDMLVISCYIIELLDMESCQEYMLVNFGRHIL